MKTRQLGNTDMQITPIGFGSWAIGGGNWVFGWGEQDDNDSIAAIRRALDLGVNWIDTAAVYGLGHAEEIVARALEGCTDRPYIFTKCGRVWQEGSREISSSLKAQSIRREVENSLRRLRVDVIDLYQIHWPIPDDDIEEGWQTMASLQEEGKVRYIGVSNFNVSQMRRAMSIAPISSLQPPYSLINREVEREILPFCQKNNIGVIVYSPMQSGLHGRIDNDADIVFLAEWQDLSLHFAINQRVGRLKRADGSDGHSAAHLADVEVGDTDIAHLALFLQRGHRLPAFFDIVVRNRPVYLIKIDDIDSQAAQAILHLAANRLRLERTAYLATALLPDPTALGKDIGPIGASLKRSRHDLFRMTKSINCGSIDPVDP